MIIICESKTIDAPYGDSFINYEFWIVHGAKSNPTQERCILSLGFQTKFIKWTMMKKMIEEKSIEGLKINLEIWLKDSTEKGHMKKKN